MKEDNWPEGLEREPDPRNAEVGSKFLDKLLNAKFMALGNVVNEQKRTKGSGSRHNNLRFVFLALVFAAAVVGLYFALPHIGKWLESLLKNL